VTSLEVGALSLSPSALQCQGGGQAPCRGTSPIRKRAPLGPYRRPMPRVAGGSKGSRRFIVGEVPLYVWGNSPVSSRSGHSCTEVCLERVLMAPELSTSVSVLTCHATGVHQHNSHRVPHRCVPSITSLLLLLYSRTGPRRALRLKLSDTRVHKLCSKVERAGARQAGAYRGTSPIRKRPPPLDPSRTLGICLR